MTIHVLCANPAIDKLYAIDGFTPGEDYPGQRPQVRYGGKGVNVARVLSQLGADVRLYAFMGEQSERAFMQEMGGRCACAFIPVPGACRTTVNIIDRQNGRETVITEAGPEVSAAHVDALLREMETRIMPGDMVCCSGSIIAGAPADLYARVSRLCKSKGVRCALDCNVKAMEKSLEGAGYALGKPNERELCAMLGQSRTQEPQQIAALARKLTPFDALLVSMGAAGGVWAEREAAYLARIPDVKVISTVGSGDASLAGAVYALSCGLDAPEALRLAMACGVANAALGEVGSVRLADVRQIAAQIDIEEIKLEVSR